jgi:hypothetical protein
MPKGKKSESARELAALHLAQGGTQEGAAAACGASVRTVQQWLTEPEFVQLVRKLRGRMFNRSLSILAAGNAAAAAELVRLLKSTEERVRLSAAREILLIGRQAQEDDLEERIALLEAAEEKRTSP